MQSANVLSRSVCLVDTRAHLCSFCLLYSVVPSWHLEAHVLLFRTSQMAIPTDTAEIQMHLKVKWFTSLSIELSARIN